MLDQQHADRRQLSDLVAPEPPGYTLKEATRGIFAPGLTVEDVEILIDRLLSRLARSRLEPFVRFGNTIRKHRDGILAAVRLGINQGRTEALNNKVRLIIRRAYGFHSAEAALALVILTGGPITLRPAAPAPRPRFTVTLTTSMPREPEIGRRPYSVVVPVQVPRR